MRDAGIPRRRLATGGHGPGCDRAGFNVRLGALRRKDWSSHWHEHFWGFRSTEGAAAGVRIHRRSYHRDGEGGVAAFESRIAWMMSGKPFHRVRLSMHGLPILRPILPVTGKR